MTKVTPATAILKQAPKRVNDSLKARPQFMQVSWALGCHLPSEDLHRRIRLVFFRGVTVATSCSLPTNTAKTESYESR
jgi:hypothetical protein